MGDWRERFDSLEKLKVSYLICQDVPRPTAKTLPRVSGISFEEDV